MERVPPRGYDGPMRIAIESGSDALDRLEGPWRALHESAPNATAFQSWDWVDCWVRRLAPTGSLRLACAWVGRDLMGIWPLWRTSGIFPVLKCAGTGPSDHLAPLVRPESGLDPRELLARVDQHFPNEALSLAELPERLACDYQRASSSTTSAIALPRTWDEYRSGLSANLRRDMRCGSLSVIRMASPESLVRDFETFLHLHRARWRRRGLPGSFATRRIRAFHKSWLQRAIPSGQAQLLFLERSGRPIASLYILRANGWTGYYQSGLNPDDSAGSPGTILIAHAIRSAIESGAATFDLLRGLEPYKSRWRPTTTERQIRILRPAPGILGTAWLGWQLNQSGIETRLRSVLESRWSAGVRPTSANSLSSKVL
jgi:CelD/BcsL family acetyltransferase involved in cellulose biosynthesis